MKAGRRRVAGSRERRAVSSAPKRAARGAKGPSRRLARFLSKYTRDVRRIANGALVRLRKRLGGGFEFVYDNYNALVIGFSATEHPSDAILSIALYPTYVNLYFLFGSEVPDPSALLQGTGARVRYIRIEDPTRLDDPAVVALIDLALKTAPEPMVAHVPRRLVIRAVSPKQRPRRPRP